MEGCRLRLSACPSEVAVVLTASPEQIAFYDRQLACAWLLGRFLACTAALTVPAPNAARIGSGAATLNVVASVAPHSHHVSLITDILVLATILDFCSPSICIAPKFCRLTRKRLLDSSPDQTVLPQFCKWRPARLGGTLYGDEACAAAIRGRRHQEGSLSELPGEGFPVHA